MGDTNSEFAAEPTVHKTFGTLLRTSAVHGSDSKTSALTEI